MYSCFVSLGARYVQGAGKSAVLNSLIGHPVLVSWIWEFSVHMFSTIYLFEPRKAFIFLISSFSRVCPANWWKWCYSCSNKYWFTVGWCSEQQINYIADWQQIAASFCKSVNTTSLFCYNHDLLFYIVCFHNSVLQISFHNSSYNWNFSIVTS